MSAKLFVLAALVACASATVFFQEKFDDGDAWTSRWVAAAGEKGAFQLSHGKFFGDESADIGLQTSQDARFYAMSTEFPQVISNKDKDLVVQFSVKHEQKIDCGGGYIKIFPDGLDQEKMEGESPYNIMFGPDICGPGTRKVHVIFSHNGDNHLVKKNIRCKDDEATHVYTLVVRPDNTYEVLIDMESVESGSLEDDWDMLPPKEIEDPEATKPEDWDDRAEIDDETDEKPEDWDAPEYIVDPEAEKPEDWDDDMDGDWEAPQIDNPDYKGEWAPKKVENPAYKGPWVHPKIANPDYAPEPELYAYESKYLGIDIWQVKSGTIFDNFFIGDSLDEAKAFAEETWGASKDGETKMREAAEEAERAEREAEAARKAKEAEEEAARAAAEAEAEDDDEDFEEEEEDIKDEL